MLPSVSRRLAAVCFTALACLLVQAGARAEAQVRGVASIKDWKVFTEKVGSDTVCFAATEARDKAPKDVNHGPVHFYVSAWKSGRSNGQPSLRVGYELRGDMPPEAVVSGKRWRMYAAGEEAFLEDRYERDLVNALKRGSELRVEAVSSKNTRTAYHFSLAGSAAAIDRAVEACR